MIVARLVDLACLSCVACPLLLAAKWTQADGRPSPEWGSGQRLKSGIGGRLMVGCWYVRAHFFLVNITLL